MGRELTRRRLLGAAGVVAAGAVAATTAEEPANKPGKATGLKILGISCSPRKGKTTATAVQAALDAARKADRIIETELIDLGGMKVSGWVGGAKPTHPEIPPDDFDKVLPKLRAANVGGIIIGSPTYFRSMSALCKAFIERCYVLRNPKLLLADKPVGVVAVGSFRNGGQELVIQQIQTALLCHEVMLVGGKPKAHQGATLVNVGDDVAKDELGMDTARKLGRRVAEAALKLAGLTLD